MTPEQYGDGDWTPEEIGAAKLLWEHHNPHRPIARLHPSISDAWMIYLLDARIARRFSFDEKAARREEKTMTHHDRLDGFVY